MKISTSEHILSLLFSAFMILFSSCTCDNGNYRYYTLTVHSVNGSVTIDPVQEKYMAGTEITLTASPDDGYDFSAWEGNEESRENPFIFAIKTDTDITAGFVTFYTADYYVDFENGNDNNDGLTESTSWKHAPGDTEAEFVPAEIQLQPGNRILFRGGVVYRGQIALPADGALSHHITYQGDDWPGLPGEKAIIDGGDTITGWTPCTADECMGISDANYYYSHVPGDVDPLSLNLHEYNTSSAEDEFLWIAQDPDPSDFYFYDNAEDFRTVSQANLTRTSITDADYFNQSAYMEDSYLLIWINPNIVVTRRILTYSQADHRVTFEDLGENAMYPDGRDQKYALYNSPHALDQPGEYFVASEPDANGLKIILRPRSTADINSRITYSVRNYGIDVNAHSNITIEGFSVIKHAGTDLTDAIGIGTISMAYMPSYNLIIRNNSITHNRMCGSGSGYGGIFLGTSYNTLVQNNETSYNPRNAGIFFGGGARITAKDNIIVRSGQTSLRLYGVEHAVVDGNYIADSNGSHANGITLYLCCRDILVVNNRVLNSGSPITFQDSGNLWFINNLIDSYEGGSNVNEWGDTSHGPWVRGTIAFLNNTLVRNNRNAALNIGDSAENTYISINNIIDGGGSGSSIFRRNNIYSGLSWSQEESYGWSLAEGEFVQEDLSLIFTDPANMDYTLSAGSQAIDAGYDVTSYYPDDIFPDYDFTLDIAGNPRDGWDIGAYGH